MAITISRSLANELAANYVDPANPANVSARGIVHRFLNDDKASKPSPSEDDAIEDEPAPRNPFDPKNWGV